MGGHGGEWHACCIDTTLLVARLSPPLLPFCKADAHDTTGLHSVHLAAGNPPSLPALMHPSTHSSQPPPTLPYCLPGAVASYSTVLACRSAYCALPICCTPLLAAAEAQTLPSAATASTVPTPPPHPSLIVLVRSPTRPFRLPASVASACRAASLFLIIIVITTAKLVGGVGRRRESACACVAAAQQKGVVPGVLC